ncbi:hypothetical protein L6Q21_07885 [Sandaracinobacter sp. RS1-74]|uniref:hypothetical protein n=1 Tax=Sandaracinobacteroides sayramensis TaxID=2913411 RepID=UPI001EDA8B9F|nr:hypothetical protein [Sandaracinobacteroides sayramensis]MCG2840898.1 hypothetical protein [Sandaracinobacteroides sayramensis]
MQSDAKGKKAAIATPAQLIEAVLESWCSHSSGEISARMLAGKAGIATSAIYYHFENLEQLYQAAQVKSLGDARHWCEAQIQTFLAIKRNGLLSRSAFGSLLAAIIDDLCTVQRQAAFAWRECQLLAARRPGFAPLLAEWDSLFRRLCKELCAVVGLGHASALTFYFFESESLFHLIRWNRLLDRAALDEIASGWASSIQGKPPLHAPIRVHLWKRAQEALPVATARTHESIARAAAKLLIEQGVSGITHRAVAAEAGLTLGVVAHQCHRAADLLEQAYGAIYLQLTGNRLEEARNTPPDQALGVPSLLQMLAIQELVLAVARGRTDAAFATSLRYLRGTTSSHTVEGRLGLKGENSVLVATILSNTMIGLLRNAGETDRQAAVIAAEAELFRMMADDSGGSDREPKPASGER